MCGRFTMGKDAKALQKDFPEFAVLKQLRARYNVAPTQAVAAWVADPSIRMDLFSWGLVPSWAKDPAIGVKMINARAETLSEKPSFRKAVQRRRCLIPMDGYYEWKAVPGTKKKQAMAYRRKDEGCFAVAGLWDTWHDNDGGYLVSATVITTRPNRTARSIHHRMPAILREEDYQRWLSSDVFDDEELRHMLSPVAGDDYEVFPVSNRVGKVGEEGAGLIRRLEEPEIKPQPTQTELF